MFLNGCFVVCLRASQILSFVRVHLFTDLVPLRNSNLLSIGRLYHCFMFTADVYSCYNVVGLVVATQ